ncbi:MAG: S8 family serine peptidase, partial [Actinomycetia bacterium]|nr:S8 family serine peptidase [Actinomycetes bacterium]
RCELSSIRILGENLRADGSVLLTAVEWAIEQRFHLVNLSLSTRRAEHKERLHDLTNQAYFSGTTIVAAAHNSPVQSYPWRFCSVISVGSHAVPEPEYLELNPEPPVEFFASGVGVTVPWTGGGTSRVSGNSFAAPHVTGLCARVLGEHSRFGTAELKHVLGAIANNHSADHLVEEPT